MSSYDQIELKVILKRLALVAGAIAAAALLGMLMARLTTRTKIPQIAELDENGPGRAQDAEGRDNYVNPDAVPLFFHAGWTPQSDHTLMLEQIELAAAQDFHEYILPVAAPWREGEEAACITLLDEVVSKDPLASFLLEVDLNPPADWLSAHPGEQVVLGGERLPFSSPASPLWLEAAQSALGLLMRTLGESPHLARLIGVAPAALYQGQWRLGGAGYDTSPANLAGFRRWLEGIYGSGEALRAAWGKPTVDFATAAIPPQPAADDPANVFLRIPSQQNVIDFQNYVSESTADALAALGAYLKEAAPRPMKVWAPYGYAMELLANEAGHFGLAILTGSDVNGFISPVSYEDRGIGGSGGFMGPVNSAQYHGKQWCIVDDTRTGVARDALTGAVSRLKGLRPEDVYSVQQRNFSAAVVQNLALAWSDPGGEGWLHDEAQWGQFAHLRDVYEQVREMRAASSGRSEPNNEEDPPAAEPPPADAPAEAAEENAEAPAASEKEHIEEAERVEEPAEESSEAAPVAPEVDYDTGMVVVVDEVSRFYQQCGGPINEILLHNNRDAAMRAGVPTQFSLLQDVLEGLSPPSPVYLFLNAFCLPEEQRLALHERLAREQASAIWIYAPGYVGETASVENIAATTGMHVAGFAAPEDAMSQYLLQGWWMKPEEIIGASQKFHPLFYVEDPEADVLALYTASRKASVAVKYISQGWTSVFVATPYLTAPLVRELLRILEQPMVFQHAGINHFDTTHVTGDLIAIHAREVGERAVELDRPYDIQDLLDPSIGWPQRQSFVMPLDTGDTRLLHLSEPQPAALEPPSGAEPEKEEQPAPEGN